MHAGGSQTLSFDLTHDELPELFEPGPVTAACLPGSGREVLLLRRWPEVNEALLNPDLRDLGVPVEYAAAGVTFQPMDAPLRVKKDLIVRQAALPPFGTSVIEQHWLQ